jgi:hypothetical protein
MVEQVTRLHHKSLAYCAQAWNVSEQKRKPADVDPVSVARSSYRAYVDKDRAAIEALIGDDLRFTGPFDNRVDRATYFARC